jgi:dephospho-CoA kinase
VGLTGGLAAGKSTVGSELARAGIQVVDADRLVSALYESGQPGAEAVRALFGDSVLDSTGQVDRVALAERAFSDSESRIRLEAAVHPLVRENFENLARQADGIIVLEATLLVEANFAPMFDLVVTVEADPELRLQRAIRRGLSPDSAKARLAAQSEAEFRVAAADVVIWNNGDLEELHSQIENLILTLRENAEDRI